jgi:hypothetical protein
MVSMVATTGDLFLATDRIRVTLEHVRKRLRYCSYVSPDPTLEDLEGCPTILHPAHVQTSLVVPQKPPDRWLADLVGKTVRLLLKCPKVAEHAREHWHSGRSADSPRKRARTRLVRNLKLPFAFGPTDYLVLVRIKPVHGKGETVGVLGRYGSRRARRNHSRLRSSPLVPVLHPGDLTTPGSFDSGAQETTGGIDQLPSLRC